MNAMSREHAMRSWLDHMKRGYDFAVIDCPPSLGMMTINALMAADGVVVPVRAQYLPAKGMTQLVKTVNRVRRHSNPGLRIEGVVLTLVDARTNLARQVERSIRGSYGEALRVYEAAVPVAVKAAESSAYGKSVFAYDASGKVARAYARLAREVSGVGPKSRDFHSLPSVDDLFTTQEECDEAAREKVSELPLGAIDPFPDHPFRVRDDEEMADLAESVAERGVLTPVVVRPKGDGRYELVSGHRRKRAAELAGLSEVPAIIRNMSEDEAVVAMVDANMQRELVLPSEKAA